MEVNKSTKANLVWTSHNLTRDHKPTEKDEAARIKRRGGRIEPYKGNFYYYFRIN